VLGSHRCEPWTSLGINCPTPLVELVGLLDEVVEEEFVYPVPVSVPAVQHRPAPQREVAIELEEEHEESEGDDVEVVGFGHRRAKRPPPDQARNAEMLMLLQLYKGAKLVGTNAWPALEIPLEIGEEAYREGARGWEFSLWTAAAAAALAVGIYYGAGAVQKVPRVLLEGLVGPPGGFAGKGLKFNASRQLQELLVGGGIGIRKFGGGGGVFPAGGESPVGGSFGWR